MSKQPSISLDNLVRLIGESESLDSVVRSVLPPAYRNVLKRASLVRSFSRDLYETVLESDDDDVPGFEDVVTYDDVQGLPRREGIYRLNPRARDQWFNAWWTDAGTDIGTSAIPEALRETAESLVDFYHRLGSPLDELTNLVFVDQEEARGLFNRLFKEAYERFDLAACQDALDAVGESDRVRNRLLEPSFKADIDESALRLRVGTMWADDWHRTARFLQPSQLREPFERLLAGEPSRVLQLYARGGMGKTMRVRWLISRWLVPERVPVARIDFDTVDASIAINDPWLLLVEAARQLNEQLPLGPFTELTADFGRFLPLLYRSSDGARAVADEFGSVRGYAAGQVSERFIDGINESAGDLSKTSIDTQPVVLIFDTVEELLLRSTGLDRWKKTLRTIHEECSSLRLLLSGRYDIDQKSPGFSGSFPGMQSVEVPPFSDDEAETYLSGLRGIGDRELVAETVRLAEGLPFKLALFADVLHERPDLTAENLREYRDMPDLLYLIERVVERIPSFGVRWLLNPVCRFIR